MLTDDIGPGLVMTWVFGLSAIVLVPVGLAAGVRPLVTADGLAMVVWLGIFSLAASYLLFGRGIVGVAVAAFPGTLLTK